MVTATKREEIREVIDTYTDNSCLYPDEECESRGENGYCVSTKGGIEC